MKSWNNPALLAAVISVLVAVSGCRTDGSGSAQTESRSVTNAQLRVATASRQAVPDRPEKLKFPPLDYEPPDPASFRVTLDSGPIAYLAEDRELPLVNIVVYVRTGSYVVPPEQTGLGGLAGYLLARGGTASRTAEELEERLAFLAAQLSSGVGDDQGSVSLNLLSKDVDEGLTILKEVLASPRFQQDKLDLAKQQTAQQMKERNDDSSSIEDREAAFLAFGEDFWAVRQPTIETIHPLTRDHLQAFHRRWFYPSNFIVAASGDFKREEMETKLNQLFSDWPFRGEPAPAIPTNAQYAEPGIYIVNKEVNQGRVSIMLPGITRDDPDYFPALVMNDILGGGGFTSRLVNRVRSDEGLAYSAGSSFPGGVHYPLTFSASFQTKSRTVPYAISIVLEEMKAMAGSPVSDLELNTAKRSFIDTFPRRFATKAQVVNTFAQDELTGRFFKEPDFWQRYRPRFEAVTKEDVKRVAAKYLLQDELVILVVGEQEQILLGHPDHEIKLSSLANGKIHEIPMRDPLTLKPISPQHTSSGAGQQ